MNRLIAILCLALSFACQAETPALAEVTVHFSPRGGAEAEIVSQIAGAKSQVRVMAYSFTSKPIIAALVAAHKRMVDVQVILDRQWNTRAPAGKDALIAAGVTALLDGKHPIMHDKVMVIDAGTVLTGSFNYTAQAERANAENLWTVRNPALAAVCLQNWHEHAGHSMKPEPPTK